METKVRAGTAVFILNSQGQILLGHRLGDNGEGNWGLVGGTVEFGEDPVTTARREVAEEVAINLKDVTFLNYTSDIIPGNGRHYLTFFFAADLPAGQEPKLCEPDKCREWRWFEPDNLPEPVFQPLKSFMAKYRHLLLSSGKSCAA